MNTYLSKESLDIEDFQKRMGYHYSGEPRIIPESLQLDGIRHLHEELQEYIDSVNAGDLAGALDALVDIVYVAKGLAYKHGFPWGEAWQAVQKANMSKMPAPSVEGGKGGVVKPEGWEAPDIRSIVEKRIVEKRIAEKRIVK